jgi:glycine/D-amino acid oxidase-like deaminating enzyme
MSDPDSFDCMVIGGGLVGSAIAYGLSRRGVHTAVLDEGDLALRASRGNFGLVWVQGKGRDQPQYARWSMQAAQHWPEFNAELNDASGVDAGYSCRGGATLALSEEELNDTVQQLQIIRQQVGADYPFEVLDHSGLAKKLPGLGPDVVGGTYCPLDGHANPLRLLRALHSGLQQRGGHYFADHGVDRISCDSGGGFRLQAAGKTFAAEKIVLCAGLGNQRLAAMVGLNVPVTPLQGQLLISERVQPILPMPTMAIRQTDEGGFQIGVSQHDVGFDLDTRTATLQEMAQRAIRMFPFLRKLRIVRSWSALRVMSPDGFPIYDRSPSHPGAYIVTCHSGVTLAANHALQVAGWIVDDTIPAEFNCFNSRRFHVPTPT